VFFFAVAQAAGDLDAEGEKNLRKALVINNITATKFANVRPHAHRHYQPRHDDAYWCHDCPSHRHSHHPHPIILKEVHRICRSRARVVNPGSTGCCYEQEKVISKTKLDIFENAFRKIKEATGVSDVNEVRTR
jgi:hypothetical protein